MSFIIVCVTGCATSKRVPVVDYSPNAKTTQTNTNQSVSQASTSNTRHASSDWRPNHYTVKKGDTLYSIGLAHGYDYKEIAAANHIPAPYTIEVGQQLNLSSLNSDSASASHNSNSQENADGVIVSAIDLDDAPQANTEPLQTGPQPSTATQAVVTQAVTLTRPKAVRQPYSDDAFNNASPAGTAQIATTASTSPEPSKTIEQADANSPVATTSVNTPDKYAVVNGISWSWPTLGKVSSKFNATNNKGLNIKGKKGQPIGAASEGKVIYAGSDLRGYGKLVIIKHSKTLLSVYAHNNKINVKEGELVKAGQKVAEMGNTDAKDVMLHFEIREKGKPVNPERFLP